MDKQLIIKKLIEYYSKGSNSSFASKLGVKPQTISTWLKRGTFDIELIFAKCEGISANWLLTGQGNMLQSEAPEGCSGGVGVQTKEDETVPQQIERLAKEAAYWKAKFEDATKK
jgi:hypothetical protein